MNGQQIEILEKELASVEWDIKYHKDKLEKAFYLKRIFSEQLQEERNLSKLLKDYTDESED